VLAVLWVRHTARSPQEVLDAAATAGRSLALLWLLSLVGTVLGVVGLTREGRKTLALWGVCLNGLILV
jgi:hypothetical protein